MNFSHNSFSAPIKQEPLGDTTSLQSPQILNLALSHIVKSEGQHKDFTLSSVGKGFSETLLGSGVDSQPAKGTMSDSDDSGPLTQREKRRKVSSRAAVKPDRETIVTDGDSDIPQSAASTLNVNDEVDAMITKLRKYLKMGETQNEASTAEAELQGLRSALSN
jgi:hypothetical protein